jgi:hypothetical protein
LVISSVFKRVLYSFSFVTTPENEFQPTPPDAMAWISLVVKPSSTSSTAFSRILAGGVGEVVGSLIPHAAATDDLACSMFVGVPVG